MVTIDELLQQAKRATLSNRFVRKLKSYGGKGKIQNVTYQVYTMYLNDKRNGEKTTQ